MTIRHKYKGKPEKLKGPRHALILHRSIILNLIDWTPWSIGKNLWVKSNIKVAIIISLDSRTPLLNFASWKRKSARLEPQLILELARSCSEPEYIAQFSKKRQSSSYCFNKGKKDTKWFAYYKSCFARWSKEKNCFKLYHTYWELTYYNHGLAKTNFSWY